MLTIADNLSTFTLGAGEPFLLQVEFQDKDGARLDISDRAFVLSFYKPDRFVQQQLAGEMDTDGGGQFLRFEEDGVWSEGLYNINSLKVELAERFLRGRNVIAAGALVVSQTAASVPSLGNAPIGRYAMRLIVRDSDTQGAAPVISRKAVPWAAQNSGGGGSTPAPVFTTPPNISPGSGTAGTTTFTATDGAASNATSFTRRWLLSGTSIGTGTTVTPNAAGSLVLEVTPHGPGGDGTPATTAPVTVAAAGGGGGVTPPPATLGSTTARWGDPSLTFGKAA